MEDLSMIDIEEIKEKKFELCERGISINKDGLTLKEEEELRKDLRVKPFVPPTSIQMQQSVKDFPVYRESKTRFYVPRFYAYKKWKNAIPIHPTNHKHYLTETSELSKTSNVNNDSNMNTISPWKFGGEMRPYQNKIVDIFMNETNNTGCGLLEIPCGRGKCLGLNTPIMMYDTKKRRIKMVQDIKEGDEIMGDDGTKRIVSGCTRGSSTMYYIRQYDGIDYRVNAEHIMTIWETADKKLYDVNIEVLYEIQRDIIRFTQILGVKYDVDKKELKFTKISIRKEEKEDMYFGFCIDGNRRFLLGDGTITHNTVMGLNIISKLKQKTLVIVHKEFLMNQWIERIEQFLPNARVGRIQGQKIDIENKDIVLGMLQSLSMIDYDIKLFRQFGFTIVDECFTYDTKVHTLNGLMEIGELYDRWIAGKELPRILSYNKDKDIFEYKDMTYGWQRRLYIINKDRI